MEVLVYTFRTKDGSRPLLSRSGCISDGKKDTELMLDVLVPFYRGAVVFI